MRDERGFTLTELLVTMFAGSIVLGAILGLVQVTTTQTVRVADRVQANQRARPVLQRLMDQLHSSCVAPDVVPIKDQSNSNQLIFVSATGNAVSPTPTRNVITISGGTMSQWVYPVASGTAPSWVFSNTPLPTWNPRILLTNVSNARVDSATVPYFRYYRYSGNQISPTPITPPLDTTEAPQTVAVSVSFAVGSLENGSRDANNAVTVSDQATLRISPASTNATVVNAPCA